MVNRHENEEKQTSNIYKSSRKVKAPLYVVGNAVGEKQ